MLHLPPHQLAADDQRFSVFLAGPILGAPRWQSEAYERLHKAFGDDVVISCPRRSLDRDPNFTPQLFDEQVDWETRYLKRAAYQGAIMFWLANPVEEVPGRVYAQTSRVELGEWMATLRIDIEAKIVVGIEPGFSGEQYLRRRLSGVPVFSTLAETCDHVFKELHPHYLIKPRMVP